MRKSLLAALFSCLFIPKIVLSGLCGFLLLALSAGTARAQLTGLTEGFDDVPSLFTSTPSASNHWMFENLSNPPPGSTSPTGFWAQGIPSEFNDNAQAGPANSFITTTFESGLTSGSAVSNWLLTPVLVLEPGSVITFWTEEAPGSGQIAFPNRLQVRLSFNGASTNVGTQPPGIGNVQPSFGDFTTLLTDINPTYQVPPAAGAYPTTWTEESLVINSSELPATTTGRIGFLYLLANNATQGSEIGIDTFSLVDPTVFTRTASGTWSDSTAWTTNVTTNGIPNGSAIIGGIPTTVIDITAQLVNPGPGTANNVDLGGGSCTLNELQFSGTGAITGTGGLIKTGSGTLMLTGTNTYSGGTTISAGTLQIGSGGTTGSITFDVTDNGVLAFDRSDSVTFAGVISGTGNVTQLGTGTTILTGTNTYSGGTTISFGTLQIGNGGTAGSITGNVTDNGVLGFDRSDSVTFAGAISGTGGVTQIGTGTTILTGTNTYSGGTTISSGALQIGNGGTAGSITGNVTDNGVLGFDRSDSVTFAGAISGTGSVTQLGTGTTILTGTNTYSGGTTISTGTLQIGNGGTAGSITGNVTDNGVLAFDRSDSVTFAGAISGTGSVTQIGTGTTILTGTNTYSGGTTISSGTLQIGNGGTAGSITGNVTDNGVLAFDRSDTVTFAGAISGTGGVTQVGAGTTILTGTNTYSGGTTISSGTLQIGNGGTAGSISGNVTDNGVLAFDRSDSVTFAGAISGTGSVTQIGTGTTILTGTNTYTGGTTINAGTLQVGSGGTTGSITGDVTDDGVLAFDRSDSVTFAGAINGTGALVQLGSGVLTLIGTNTYSGGTTISAGTLQVGNGGTTGSIIGNVVDNGTLLFNRSNTLSFGGVVSGTGSLEQNGSGSTILSGTNTYTGGTIVNAGTLTVNSAQALGLGNVVVNGGILTADPQPINVKGNYTQNAGGTIQLQVAGANPGQYDTLNVGGNATLGGTLQLLSLGFQPKAGNQLTLVTTGGVVSGRFAQFLNPFASGPAFNTVDLVYGRNSVLLEFLNLTSPVPSPIPPPALPSVPSSTPPSVIVTVNFASFALTPNQLAAGNLIDQDELNPKVADLISFLAKQPISDLPSDLAQISPDALTSFYEITFSNANIQRLNIEGRLDDLRTGSTGFNSNMNVSPPPVSPEGKGGVEGKAAKNPVEQALQPAPENRWGIWVTGFGDFVNVEEDYNGHGYDFTTGGFTVGVDYRITDQFAIGAMGEYAHTWTSLKPSGDIDVNSGRGGVYATWFTHGFYLNGAIYGGGADYSSGRATLGGMANGSTSGAEYSAFISGGYDFHYGRLTIGPTAALQYTYININSFDEHGSLAPLNIHSQSAESLRTDFGARASYLWQVGKVLVEPSLRAALGTRIQIFKSADHGRICRDTRSIGHLLWTERRS